MSIKNNVIISLILFMAPLALTSCASKGANESQAEVIHLTSPNGQPQASIRNPKKDGNVTVSTADTEKPLIAIESSDGMPPDSEALVSQSTTETEIEKLASQHKVAEGDTLYSIARKYGKDYETLALTNKLDVNYTIFPGQVLQLDTDGVIVDTPKKVQPTKKEKPVKPAVVEPVKNKNKTKIYGDRIAHSKGGLSWIWPVLRAPKVLRPFSNSRGENVKGLDIAGEEGDSIIATSDGIVVYAGSELNGYGNLIIISHGERYISAYAHNQKILVQEEQKVKQGQKIALMGSTGSDQTKLFFQIRKDSQPVDPIGYLPPR